MVILVAAELVTVENPTKTLVATTRAAAPHFHLLVNRFIAAPSFSVDGRARSSKPGCKAERPRRLSTSSTTSCTTTCDQATNCPNNSGVISAQGRVDSHRLSLHRSRGQT